LFKKNYALDPDPQIFKTQGPDSDQQMCETLDPDPHEMDADQKACLLGTITTYTLFLMFNRLDSLKAENLLQNMSEQESLAPPERHEIQSWLNRKEESEQACRN